MWGAKATFRVSLAGILNPASSGEAAKIRPSNLLGVVCSLPEGVCAADAVVKQEQFLVRMALADVFDYFVDVF